MVSVLASSAVDREFEPWSGQTKDSAKQAALEKEQRLVGSESE
jgi:hypothetical protein